MRSNRSLDGTPMQRAPRRVAPVTLFSDSELDHLNRSPSVHHTIQQFGIVVRRYAVAIYGRLAPSIRSARHKARPVVSTIARHAISCYRWVRADRRRLGAAIIVIMVSIYGAALLTRGTPRTNSPDPSPAAPTAGVRQPLSHGTPDFDTVLPSNKSIDQLGGWTRVSPASSAPVYAYTDTIDHVSVIVSQQVLPNDLQRDTTAQLKQLASLYAPAEPLAGVSGAYISRSRSGPASVVCVRGSILIFVKTNDAVSDNALSSYITSLR